MKDYNKFIFEIRRNEGQLFYQFVDYYLNSDLITNESRNLILSHLNQPTLSEYLINENFFDSFKKRYDKAKTVVKNFPEQAKDSLNKIVDAAKTSVDFVNNIINKLKTFINNVLTNSKNKMVEKLKADKNFSQKLKEIVQKDKGALIKDVDTLGKVVKFYQEKLSDNLLKYVRNALNAVLVGDKQPVVENIQYMKLCLENAEMGNNVIQKLVHGIESLPPFSWLHNLKNLAEKGVNSVIEGLSFITEKLGGPKFILPIVASLLAIAIEYNIKGLIKHGIIEAAAEYAIPFIGVIVKTIGFIATTIAVYEVIKVSLSTHQQPAAQSTNAPVKPIIKPTTVPATNTAPNPTTQ